ncbi:hypothetical protein C8R43DRAFT_1123656 [Mycena crocata]|nr:hypothetical protein C8R43DRAFT_1123656 [Mycena crocata]
MPPRKANMLAEDVVPDTNTPDHDPRYWCLPPMMDDGDEVFPVGGGGFEFHLVTHGRQVGVWRSWTVAQTMISGFPHNDHKGHHTYAGCIVDWQRHCPLGEHPHPVDPHYAARIREGRPATGRLSASRSLVGGTSTASRRPRRSASTPGTAGGPLLARIALERESPERLYAIWNGRVVYSSQYAARLAFEDALEAGDEPELLSTDDFDSALAYAEGNV